MAAHPAASGDTGSTAEPGGGVPPSDSPGVVLLVEDDDTIAGLLIRIIGRGQRTVLRARNGEECLSVFAANVAKIALVILDCRLPDAEGLALCRELRRQVPDLPVLLTSGKQQATASLGAASVTDFLPKPFRLADVELKVSALLGATA
jgi:DNA-binding response OmpR family regulator